MNNINKVCKLIAKLTEEDFTATKKMAQSQIDYLSPLKMGTTIKVNSAGKNNMKILAQLKKLKTAIENGKP